MERNRNWPLVICVLSFTCVLFINGCMQAHDLGTNPNRTGANVSHAANPQGPHTLDVGGHRSHSPVEANQHNLLSVQQIAAQIRLIPGINQAYVLYGNGVAYVAVDVKRHNLTERLKSQVIHKVKQMDPNLHQVLVTADYNAVHAFREYAANIDRGHPTSMLWNQLHNVQEVINRIFATHR
jgi:YhcN/YlaJ family sporulation lipoprotein